MYFLSRAEVRTNDMYTVHMYFDDYAVPDSCWFKFLPPPPSPLSFSTPLII